MSMRRARGLFLVAGLFSLPSCGGQTSEGPPPNAKPKPEIAIAAPTDAPEAPPPAPVEPAPPEKLDSLLRVVPRDIAFVAHLPSLEALLGAMPAASREALASEVLSTLAGRAGLDPKLLGDVTASFEEAVVFGLPGAAPGKKVCLGIRTRDGAVLPRALQAIGVELEGGKRFVVHAPNGLEVGHGAWLDGTRVLFACRGKAELLASFEVARGVRPSIDASPLFVKERAADAFVSVDMHEVAGGDTYGAGSRIFASLPKQSTGVGIDVRFSGYGPVFPPLGSIFDASPQVVIPKLPDGAIAALGLSIERAPGKTLADVFAVLGKTLGIRLGGALEEVGTSVAEVDALLGGEAALGLYVDPKHPVSLDSNDFSDHVAVLVAIATKDAAAQKKLFGAAASKVKKDKGVRVSGDTITRDEPKGKFVQIQSRPGFVLVGAGPKSLVSDVSRRFGKQKGSLGESPSFLTARAKEKAASHVQLFFDPTLALTLADPDAAKKLGGGIRRGTMLSLLLFPSDRGLELALTGDAAAEVLGIGAAIGIQGTRRYIARSKTAEARATLRSLGRAAMFAYEREWSDGGALNRLCKSAKPVPSSVPKAMKYAPSPTDGVDFETGDANTGWRCLRFNMTTPMYYQYDYRVGGNYKGPKRGGPDPGKNGFEVSAEGDLDGDGNTSLFTLVGKVQNGTVVLSPQIFVSDELE